MISRSRVPIALISAVLLSAPVSAQKTEANDVSLELSFAGGISTFHSGDPVRLELSFTAQRAGLSLNMTTTTPPSPVDTIFLTPTAGTFNWMEDEANGHRYSPDYAGLVALAPANPVKITLTLNDIYRFDTPGHYTVRVLSRRLSGGMQDLGRGLPPLESNELSFDLEPADSATEASEAASLERQIRSAGDMRSAQALAQRLDYLPGDAATEAKLSLLLNPKNFYPFGVSVREGLWISRNRSLVVQRLEKALRDPNQVLDAGTGVFETTIALAASLQRHSQVTPDGSKVAGTAADDNSADIKANLCHVVAMTLSERKGESQIGAARTVFLTLIQSGDTVSPDFQVARDILITHFDEVNEYNVDWLLNAYGKYLDDPRLYPILQRMLNSPNVSRTAILRFLALHDSANVRTILATELCAAHASPLTSLRDTSIETMPEADSCLLDRIRSDAAAPDLSRGFPRIELENRMALAARFASPAIYDPLFNIYTANGKTWPLQVQGYALAYLSRWQPERARPLLDAALPVTASQMEPNISFALFQANMGDSLIPFLRDRVLHSPPGQAEGAAYRLSQEGATEDRSLLRERLAQWRTQWKDKTIPADEARFEAELASAIAQGKDWQSSPQEKEGFWAECLTDTCRARFPHTAKSQ
jgi:hypothetical protein